MTNQKHRLTHSITYVFRDGTPKTFKGKPCYRLSNSWRDAMKQASKECESRGETFDKSRMV
jgi:hypothetical protein